MIKRKVLWLTVLCSIFLLGCLPGGQTGKGGYTITVYGFSIMKEALEKDIYPAFAAKWKREKGEDIHFVSSFAGSETAPIKFCRALPPTSLFFPIERAVDRLIKAGHVPQDWYVTPQKGIVNKTENVSARFNVYLTLSIFSFNESSRFCASTASADFGDFLIISRQPAPS